jgi:hypothetical protein
MEPHTVNSDTAPVHATTFVTSSAPSHTGTMPAPLLRSCPPVSSHAADTDATATAATATAATATAAAAAAASNIENVKLHPFDVNDPNIWIYQAESIFRRKNIINPLDRYDIILAHLPTNIISSLKDIITTVNKDSTDAYQRLKTRLLTSYGKTDWELASDLFDHPGLGDSKPSHLMNSLMSMLPPGEQTGVLFLTLFFRRLPVYIRHQLAALPTRDPQQLAAHADLIWTANGCASAAINQLTNNTATTVPTTTPYNRCRSPSPRRSPSTHRSPSPRRWCFFQRKFGHQAQRCQAPAPTTQKTNSPPVETEQSCHRRSTNLHH